MTQTQDIRDPATIDPERFYPSAIARLFIPSHMLDAPISMGTIRNWLAEGKFPNAQYRKLGSKRAWFIPGSDLLDAIGIKPAQRRRPGPKPRASAIERLRGEEFKNI